MRTLYLDCPSGISGDMFLAALVDLGASEAYIRDGLKRLSLSEEWDLQFERVTRRSLAATYARVTVAAKPADAPWSGPEPGGRSRGGAHQTGHEHEDPHEHEHPHEHQHPREHAHERGHGPGAAHGHAHVPHRPYREIKRLLEEADLPPRVRSRAQAVFAELARAEGAVHGIDPEDVHFHEVGSTDAIIDVVGVCLGLESLGVDALEASPLHVGRGFVWAAHGRLPVPAPATLRLLEGMEFYQTDVEGELVTPTGAALVRALCRRVGPLRSFRLLRAGYGAGTKELPIPNVLRALLGEVDEALEPECLRAEELVEVRANIDDMNPQIFGALLDRLLASGALDAWIEAATMKKGRPGHVLHALGPAEKAHALCELVLRETTTLGVRWHPVRRLSLDREWIRVPTRGGDVRVKVARRGGEVWNVAAEYDDCLDAAHRSGRPLKEILAEAEDAARRALRAPFDEGGGPCGA